MVASPIWRRFSTDRSSGQPTPPPGDWKFPPIDLLEPPISSGVDDARSIEMQARRLENALKSFRVEANVVGAKVGPAVTMFELEVATGTRMNKVTQLSQEIAAALRAAGPGDAVLIAGKGHETFQEVAGTHLPFDDGAVAREVLATRLSPNC